KSKPLQSFTAFPGLLVDSQESLEEEFKDYSYAFYVDDKLLGQSGNYIYNLANTNLKGQLKKYIYKTTSSNSKEWFARFTTYSHLIYMPAARNLIVVSKEQNRLFF